MPAIGQTIKNRYRIIDRLAEGGQSRVYLAIDTENDSKDSLILKEMISVDDKEEQKERITLFEREYSLLKDLRHPLLIKVLDFFEENDNYYIVEEYVQGKTLESILRKDSVLEECQAVNIGLNIAEALSFLHQHNIIYRDLKPSNIVIDVNGQAKLIDFTIARTFKAGKRKDTIVIGTLGYSPPEQYGRGQTDCRSDIYSLGVLLHQLVTGIDPASKTFRAKFNEPFPQIKPVIEKATRISCEDRYQTTEEFMADLQKYSLKKPHTQPSISVTSLSGSVTPLFTIPPTLQTPSKLKSAKAKQQHLAKIGLEIGDVLEGRYKIKEILGEKTLTRFYTAEDQQTNKKYLVEENPFSHGSVVVANDRILGSFDEYNLKLRHPVLINVYAYFHINNNSYYIEDYVEGTILPANQKINQDRAVEIICQLTDMFICLNKSNVTINKIKLQNIIITSDQKIRLVEYAFPIGVNSAGDTIYTGPFFKLGKDAFVDEKQSVYLLSSLFSELLGNDLSGVPLKIKLIIEKATEKSSNPKDIITPLISLLLSGLGYDRNYKTIASFKHDLAGNPNKILLFLSTHTETIDLFLYILFVIVMFYFIWR